jgi:DNA-binding NtrC family response regulator
VLDRAQGRLASGARGSDEDRALYEDACLYWLYDGFDERIQGLIEKPVARVDFYDELAREHARLLALPGAPPPDTAHLFACFFQIRRAFHYVFSFLLGGSLPAARLRAATWRSIFSRDMRRYQRSLFARMDDISTLVTGPTGTGKELVARAIGLSRYVPFDAETRRFAADHAADYHPLNLSALSPSVIESELFGHEKGAYTGAEKDRSGWLEACKPGGTVFLDEIGELDTTIQVKLLRVLQTRQFERMGSMEKRTFSGRVVAATHRDLDERMRAGLFREDLYYRLCADRVTTPSLREQLDDAPEERRRLVHFIAVKAAGRDEADAITDEVEAWIDKHLPPDYPWPGNVRELEQRVRLVMMQGDVPPAELRVVIDEDDDAARPLLEGTLPLEEAMQRYVTLVQARTGSYAETARQLEMDERTVSRKVDRALLAKLRGRRR